MKLAPVFAAALFGLLAASSGAAQPAEGRAFGLFPAELFVEMAAEEAEGLAPAAGLWYFQGEWIAVPKPGLPVTGRPESPPAPAGRPPLPPIVWVAAPELVEGARLEGDDRLRLAGGAAVPFSVVPPTPPNDLYVDFTTFEFFAGRPLRLRGATVESPAGRRFVARTIWPEDARIPWRSLRLDPVVEPESLADLVRAQAPEWPSARLLWERPSEAPRSWAGLPALAIVLSGAQGDAPGSHAGHIAVATGRLGAEGEWTDWLANNIYPLEPGDKRISVGPVPMDNYLADLNSGQALYRPVYVLVAVMRSPEAAEEVQAAFQEFYLRYWCHEVEFHKARHNSTEMSLDTLRGIGWRVPKVGGTSGWKGLVAAAGTLVVTFRPKLARQAWSFFTEERTDLFPRVAFETAAADLLAWVEGTAPRAPTPFEARLADDTEAVLFLRFPQIPSSRPFGTYPAGSVRGYRARVGLAEIQGEPEPEEERPLPEHLRRACRERLGVGER